MLITVKVEKTAGTISIGGESAITDHTGELEALAVRDLVTAPAGSAKAYVSEIMLTRDRDKGTPKLCEACSMGENIGTVTIYCFRTVSGGSKVFLTYTLTETFVSRIEHETADGAGGAYMAHQGYSGLSGHPYGALWRAASLTQNADRNYSRLRAGPNPVYSLPPTTATDKEIERVWLSPATITWTYTPYSSDGTAGGNVEKAWNLQTSAEVTA